MKRLLLYGITFIFGIMVGTTSYGLPIVESIRKYLRIIVNMVQSFIYQ